MENVYIVLQNGSVFTGKRFGAAGDITGEIVFTTAMTGYVETLTDPSYHGQMVVQTFPLIGNYGIIPEDFESKSPMLSAYIVRKPCAAPSNFRGESDLDSYLKKQGVVGVCDVDTRALTRFIREYGVMNASILSELPKDPAAYGAMLSKKELSSDVSHVTSHAIHSLGGDEKHVVLWDFGYKGAMAAEMMKRGCKVTVVPSDTTAETVASLCPDGILLSNGPGDPAVNQDIIRELRTVATWGKPVFGICLGHQLLAHAKGGATHKLKYGHRGTNQPVRYTPTGHLYITSQNHGYAVDTDQMPQGGKMSFVNINDDTCEGIEYTDIPAFSVQFHPEACGGPKDTNFLFDQFLAMMKGETPCL